MKFDFSGYLVRRFIPSGQKPDDPAWRACFGYLEGWVSVGVNFLIFAVKLALGLALGSISVIADAVHTASDAVTSVVVIAGFKISKKPPDKEHPFGHGRMENIATVIIAVLLCVAGLEILRASAGRFMDPPVVGGNLFAAGLLILTAVLKEWLARFSLRLSRHIDSLVLEADAWHHRTDAISTLLVAGAVIASMFRMFRVDAVCGALVAGYIIYTGIVLIKDASIRLMGKAADEKLYSRIKELTRSVPGVEGIHDIVAHDYGTHQAISLHVEVSSALDSSAAHTIAEAVENKIAQNINSSPVVHIDLKHDVTRKPPADTKILNRIFKSHPQVLSYHGVQISGRGGEILLSLHIVVSRRMSVAQSHSLEHAVRQSLKKQYAGCTLSIHVEPCNANCAGCSQTCKVEKPESGELKAND